VVSAVVARERLAACNWIVLALHLALLAHGPAIGPALLCDEAEACFVIREFGIKVLECVPLVSGDALALLPTLFHGRDRIAHFLLVVKG
jgi:hypothetical protein